MSLLLKILYYRQYKKQKKEKGHLLHKNCLYSTWEGVPHWQSLKDHYPKVRPTKVKFKGENSDYSPILMYFMMMKLWALELDSQRLSPLQHKIAPPM